MTVEQHSRPAPAPGELGSMPLEPAIWIGSQADYDGERQHGDWVGVARPLDEVSSLVGAVVERTPDGLGQRWAVHELRNFGSWQPREEDGLPAIVHVALGIRYFGLPYAGLVSVVGADSVAARFDRFRQSFLGSWPTMRDFAHQMAYESGWYDSIKQLPRPMQGFVQLDLDQVAVSAARDLTVVGHDAGVWVFDPRRW